MPSDMERTYMLPSSVESSEDLTKWGLQHINGQAVLINEQSALM